MLNEIDKYFIFIFFTIKKRGVLSGSGKKKGYRIGDVWIISAQDFVSTRLCQLRLYQQSLFDREYRMEQRTFRKSFEIQSNSCQSNKQRPKREPHVVCLSNYDIILI